MTVNRQITVLIGIKLIFSEMSESVSATFTRLIIAWVSAVERHAAMVVAATILVTATLFYYTATNLTVNTDTTEMISNELPFRRVYKDYKRLFPQYVDNLLVVIEAAVPEIAESTAATLAERMESNTELFNYVFAPASEPGLPRVDEREAPSAAEGAARSGHRLTPLPLCRCRGPVPRRAARHR